MGPKVWLQGLRQKFIKDLGARSKEQGARSKEQGARRTNSQESRDNEQGFLRRMMRIGCLEASPIVVTVLSGLTR